MENKKEAWDRNSSMQVGGKVLFLLCGMLWLYRHDLNPVNSIVAVVLFFRLAAYGVAKTSLYSKKELERSSPSLARRAKIYSTLIALSIVFLLLSTAAYVFFSEQVGGNPGSYDSENFYDGAFHNLKQPDDSSGSFLEQWLDT